MTPTPDPYSFLITSNPLSIAGAQIFGWLTSHWWAFVILIALFIIFIAHRTLMTRYGTDPRWKSTSQLDQIIDFEKQEHPQLEEDDHLPTSHYDI